MDPLSLAASVIAVVQLSQAVIVGCYRLHGQMKDAEKDISSIITEAQALTDVLEEIADIATASKEIDAIFAHVSISEAGKGDARNQSALNACFSALTACKTVLGELKEKLAPLCKPGLRSRLKWPLESSNVQRKLEIIAKQKSTLSLALEAYQARLLTTQVLKTDKDQKQSKRADALNWYKTSNPEQNHNVSRARHEPKTASWVFDEKSFCRWKETPGELLWLHGIPGAGKTILCSTIIDHMQTSFKDNARKNVVYFYFDFADNKKQSLADLLKSVIYQLASSEPELSDPVAALYDAKNRGIDEATIDELLAVVLAEVAKAEVTYLLIDALDECPGPDGERASLFNSFLKQALPQNLNILITSRKEPDIESAMEGVATHTICIQSSAVDADVRTYVNNVIARDPKLKDWKPAIKQDILDAVVAGAHGMFRWAVCQLDTIKQCLTPAMVKEELKSMPETLDQTYDRILKAVPARQQLFVQSALHWLAFAVRPLLLAELAEAAVIRPQSGTFDPETSRFMKESSVLDLCGVLVTSSAVVYRRGDDTWLTEKLAVENTAFSISSVYETNYSVFSLSHYSVKEYIVSQRLQNGFLTNYYTSEKLAHNYLAQCCLLYLLEYNNGKIATKLNFDEYYLLEYASRNWIDHWKQASRDDQGSSDAVKLHALLERFLSSDPSSRNAYLNWLNVWNPDAVRDIRVGMFYHREMIRSADLRPQPLYWAASLGHLLSVRSLIDDGADIKATEGYFESAFGAACYYGHLDVVDHFLDQGADASFQSKRFGNVLQVAAMGGSKQVVQRLLDVGADVNAKGGEYNTALIAAASKEHEDIVKLLVKRGADINVGSRTHGSSLYQAAAAGDMKMVITLLGAGADINETGVSDGTPLYAAALSGSLPLVQFFIRKRADVNKASEFAADSYPIIGAAKQGHSQIVRALVRAGADPNLSRGSLGKSALEAAVESRDMQTFRAVLDANGDPNIQGRLYKNCFHAAIWTGELDMAEILLHREAEFEDEAFLEAVGRYDQNPVFLDTLMKRNPDVNAYGSKSGSALHVAIKERNEDAAWILLQKDPYVNAVTEEHTPLSAALDAEMIDLAKEFIRRGADINRRHKAAAPFEQAVYYACQEEGSLEIVDLLLDMGLNIKGDIGDALLWPLRQEKELILRYLLAKGIDLDRMIPCKHTTAVQYLAAEGKTEFLKLLLELGADINAPAEEGGATLHFGLQSGNREVVHLLLDNCVNVDDTHGGPSLLCTALHSKLDDLIPLLLERGADVCCTLHGNSPLATALEAGKTELVKLLMDSGAQFADTDIGLLTSRMSSGKPLEDVKELLDMGMDPNIHSEWQSAIEVAVQKGRKDVVELLLEYGADLNPTGYHNAGPLTQACGKSDMEMAAFLLENGADPNFHCKDYRYPLYNAVGGTLPMVELLLEHGADIGISDGDSFAQAMWSGEKFLDRLLEEPMTPTQREFYLDCALQAAAYYTNLQMCTWLLDVKGANVNHRPGQYGSPLQAALSNEQVYTGADVNNRQLIVDLFLSRGADINPPTTHKPFDESRARGGFKQTANTYSSPLTLALSKRSRLTARRLLEAGADPNIVGGELHAPLQAAAKWCPSMIPNLLEADADVNATGGAKYGTALHAAAFGHDADAVDLLLAAGADVSILAGKYGTVLQAAAKLDTNNWTGGRQSVRVMEKLVEAGADVNASGGRYGSALQMAAKSGSRDGVKWLVSRGADVFVKGGKWGSVYNAAVKKDQWGVVSWLEQHYGSEGW